MGTVKASSPTASQTTVASPPGACDYQARVTRLRKRSLLPLGSLTPHRVHQAERPRGHRPVGFWSVELPRDRFLQREASERPGSSHGPCARLTSDTVYLSSESHLPRG